MNPLKGIGFGLVASGLIMMGLFLLPLGYDFIFHFIMDNLAGGDYWTAVRYMYMISVSLIVGGVAIEYFSD